MDETLPLAPMHPLLPLDRPFTPATARTLGVERSSLDRMLREGTIRRLVRGVYVASTAPDSTSLRAQAVALAIGRKAIAVDRTAAWVHGVHVRRRSPCELPSLESVHGGRSSGSTSGARELLGRDVQHLDDLRVTTPLRTALDLGRSLAPDLALGAMDLLLA
jgi:hypothetical protein